MTKFIRNRHYCNARFLTSIPNLKLCPPDNACEVAFTGYSNSGKSSALNTVTGSKIASTSKAPGCTQMINYFTIKIGIYLVDLPGYGYAKVPKSIKIYWNKHLNEYLENRKSLVGLVLLMDIRHLLKEFDRMMIKWSIASDMPLHILLNKSDKLQAGVSNQAINNLQREFFQYPQISIQLFSALKKTGVNQLVNRLNSWLLINKKTSMLARKNKNEHL